MTRRSSADLLIRRILFRTAGKAAHNRFDARKHLVDGLGAPIAASSEHSGFSVIGRFHSFVLRECRGGHRKKACGDAVTKAPGEAVYRFHLLFRLVARTAIPLQSLVFLMTCQIVASRGHEVVGVPVSSRAAMSDLP